VTHFVAIDPRMEKATLGFEATAGLFSKHLYIMHRRVMTNALPDYNRNLRIRKYPRVRHSRDMLNTISDSLKQKKVSTSKKAIEDTGSRSYPDLVSTVRDREDFARIKSIEHEVNLKSNEYPFTYHNDNYDPAGTSNEATWC